MEEFTINFALPASVRELHQRIAGLSARGKCYRFTVVEDRKRRSDRQLRYYFPCFVAPFGEYLRAQGNPFTDLEVHEYFKERFNGKVVADPETGEVRNLPQSTRKLNTTEFNDFLDRIADWLRGFQIVIPPPGVYHERDEVSEAA